jgi:hypothetical protein
MKRGALLQPETWAKARRRLLRTLKPRLEGVIAGGAPETVVRSLVEQLHRPEIRRHVKSIYPELPARIAHYPLDPELPEWFRREKALDPIYSYEMANVVASPSTGLVWLDGEALALEESVGSLRRMLGWGDSLWETNQRPVEGPEYAVVLPWTAGYFHFLLESLPAFIRSLQLAGSSAEVVVSEARPPVVDEALSLLGIAPERRVTASHPLKIRRQVFTGLTPYSGFVEASDIQLLKSSISNLAAPRSPETSSIYVSRQNTPKRPLANEPELEEALSSNGFEVVCTERLSLKEQIEMFRRATCVVAPHGAGLANLVWGEEPCKVVEIFPYGMHNDCYARLAASLDFGYRPIACGPSSAAAGLIDIAAVLDATGL